MKNRLSHPIRFVSTVVLFFFLWTFGGVFDVAFAIQAIAGEQQPPKNSAEDKLAKRMAELKKVIENESVDRKSLKDEAQTIRTEMDALDVEIRGQFGETEKKLKGAGLPEEILQRHYKFVRQYEENLNRLRDEIDALERAQADTDFNGAVESLKSFLEKVKPPKRHQKLNPDKLPHRTAEPVFKEPRLKKEDFERDFKTKTARFRPGEVLLASNGPLTGLLSSGSSLLAQASLPSDSDLAQTIEVQFTDAIKAKAQELGNNPVNIYNWVRNNIEYAPTYGSIQGADMCLQTRLCNDIDTASLLIALLRASNIPARYVYGTIELPIEKVKNWVGGFTDSKSALNLIASGGIPVTGLTSAGQIAAARIEHAWVEAWVDYIPSRGAVNRKGTLWVPLDPSFKQYSYGQGIDIRAAVPFDAQGLVDQARSASTVNESEEYATNLQSSYIQQQIQAYQANVQNYLNQNYPSATADDVLGKKEIIKQEFPYLLGTLPFRTIVKGGVYSEVPDSLRHKVSFRLNNPLSYEEDFVFTASIPELGTKRITLSFGPASANDKNLILAYGSSQSLPAYMINLRPELKIDGITKAAGSAIVMGTMETFDMTFISPGSQGEVVSNEITAGEYYAIALDQCRITEPLIQKRIAGIESIKSLFDTGQYGQASLDDVTGEALYSLALTYFYELDSLDKTNSRTLKVVSTRFPSEGIVSQGLIVSYSWFGTPYTAKLGGFNIDVDRDIVAVAPLGGDGIKARNFMIISGSTGSALEHGVFEQVFGKEGISAIKALTVASNEGIPIYEVTSENISRIMPQLQLSSQVKQDISNGVNAGKTVTVSKTEINYLGWQGVGYLVKDPNTGAAGYMISGGSAGGGLLSHVLNSILSLFASPDDGSSQSQAEQAAMLGTLGSGYTEAIAAVAIAELLELIASLVLDGLAGLAALGVGMLGTVIFIVLMVIIIAAALYAAWLIFDHVIMHHSFRRQERRFYIALLRA